MADDEVSKNVPEDEHLRQDVAPEPERAAPDPQKDQFAPGQTNAGQQVSGLASASGYGKDLDPEAGPDGNNPA
ncbi:MULTISPECIES: hypothetical protein [Micrococcaceae]|uniref:Uncharacterized protein n=1 Tax=Arthrobacter sedimenti TaxID=2694931 RepID=A0ABV8WKZ6_9MICC|nr:hypothetical protein [Pseudarthrobacter defluvii]WJH24132.1 hypothetical protein JCQ34_17215 [Pseudarthrobacter defluvii]